MYPPNLRSQPSGARNQAESLRAEGVHVTTGALGELLVDFAEYGWFPSSLPSEGSQIDSDYGTVGQQQDDEDV